MRIISEHRDYYDCIMAQGVDLTCVWVRSLEEVEYKDGREWPFPKYRGTSYYIYRRSHEAVVYEYIIGFCGKIYPVLEIKKQLSDGSVFCHNVEEIDNFVEANFKAKEFDSYMKPNEKGSWRARNRNSIGITHKGLVEFFEECRLAQSSHEHIFVDNGCPVFLAEYNWKRRSTYDSIVYHGRREDSERPDDDAKIVKRNKWCGNVVLKDLEFFRIFDPPQAYQEVWQYLGGILGLNNPHVPEMDDLTKRDGHGFDNWSFKKEPSKKR